MSINLHSSLVIIIQCDSVLTRLVNGQEDASLRASLWQLVLQHPVSGADGNLIGTMLNDYKSTFIFINHYPM